VDATLVLAIIGAVTGTASAVAQVFSTVRDRPRLLLRSGHTDAIDEKPTIWLEVTNAGQRATTVREVGFFAKETTAELSREGQVYGRSKALINFPFGHSLFLESGQSKRMELRPDTLNWNLHADFPLRAYAVDIRGRRVWGEAVPLLRMLVGDDPRVLDVAPDELKWAFEPSKEPQLPAQVEPRWKLWKRKELRRPEAWKPH
jgi:hypothetical protein